jgi:molecular chaperone DnaK
MITGGTKLADDEIEKMVREAEAHADEDRKRREEAEARNQAENAIYQTEKTLKEHGEKLDASDRKMVEDALQEVREAMNGSDADRIRHTTEQLVTASQKFAEVLYQRAQTEAGPSSPNGSEGGNDDVVDAEVVDEGQQGA